MTIEDLRKVNDQYAKIRRKYPIDFIEEHEAQGRIAEGVVWPEGVEAAYVVQRKRIMNGRSKRVIVHIEPNMMPAVRWALTDNERGGA